MCREQAEILLLDANIRDGVSDQEGTFAAIYLHRVETGVSGLARVPGPSHRCGCPGDECCAKLVTAEFGDRGGVEARVVGATWDVE